MNTCTYWMTAKPSSPEKVSKDGANSSIDRRSPPHTANAAKVSPQYPYLAQVLSSQEATPAYPDECNIGISRLHLAIKTMPKSGDITGE